MNPPTDRQIRTEFIAFFPDLKRTLQRNFRNLKPEARSEAVTEAIGISFLMWINARRRGRPATKWSIARYASMAVRDGRSLAGRKVDDVLGSGGRNRHRRPNVYRLDHLTGDVLDEMLVDRRSRAAADTAGFRIDWDDFVEQQPKPTKKAMDMLALGFRRGEVAQAMRVSRPAISQRMYRTKRAWQAFCGEQPKAAAS